jgi:hypothetical protein
MTLEVNGRPVEDGTGRFLDGKEPRYVSESAERMARRVAELEYRRLHPPPPRGPKADRPAHPPITDEDRTAMGLPPKRR